MTFREGFGIRDAKAELEVDPDVLAELVERTEAEIEVNPGPPVVVDCDGCTETHEYGECPG